MLKLIVAAVLALGLTACEPAYPETPAPSTTSTSNVQTIKRVVDGDTIVLANDERVRLIGVDTPETVDPRRPDGCYGKEASDHTKALLPAGTEVRLVRDVSERDRNQRLLAYVYRSSDGLFVNADLVRNGYAIAKQYPPDVAHAGEFKVLEQQARDARVGMWGAC